MSLGATVIQKRQERGLTQKELAERVGMPASKLCRIEKGYGDNPGVYDVVKIARGLACSASELLKAAGIEAEQLLPAAAAA